MTKLEIGAVKFRNRLNQIFPGNQKHLFSTGIITAAGSGNRMGGVSKQLMEIGGKPCVLYSLLAFQNCREIDEIIVVAKEEEISIIQSIALENKITKLSCVVPGSATRQGSVLNGFLSVNKKCELVAIHDGARPLIRPEQITILLENARRWGASCFAKKMTDTVKIAKEGGLIDRTLPRDELFAVQTPQVFKADLYRASLAIAQKDQIQATDDCALAECAGFPIKLVEFSEHNIKLTHPQDKILVECILKERDNG